MHEKTVEFRTAFDGKLLRLDVLDVELESGGRSVREVVRLLTETEMDRRVADGAITDAKTLAAWMLYKARFARAEGAA